MKRVLITGANSFLGDNTCMYLREKGDYIVDILDMIDNNWREIDFSKYDIVFNVCAIVHRFDKVEDALYYAVNRDLAVEIAKKAKKEGVGQFIQTSTNGVFGIDVGVMSNSNGFNPKTPYEKSKYEADCLLEELRCEEFKVCIIRPPMMYGNGCKGNFPRLEGYSIKHKIFPSWKNQKDFIYIKNMVDFVKFAMDNNLNEICYPRDAGLVSVSEIVQKIAELNGNKMHFWKIFNPFIGMLYKFSHTFRIIFGDCYCIEAICSKKWEAPYTLNDALIEMYKKGDAL